jgi:putative membrane protein
MSTLLRKLSHPRTLVVVLLLPLLVVGIGMWALSGRVDNVDKVPAAVVNLDKGAKMKVDGKEQNVPLGRQLAGGLTQPDTVDSDDKDDDPEDVGFDWSLTTKDDAEKGLKDGTYGAVVVIPKDFSKNLTTIGKKDAVPAEIKVNTNDASGALNSVIGSAVSDAAANTMGGEFTKQYLDGLYVGFNDMHKNFSKLADGADELSDGAGDLSDGADKNAKGTHDLADGASELADGTQQLADQTPQLAEGTRGLADGVGQFSGGMGQLATGADGIADGVDGLAGGLDQLGDGADGLADGVGQLDQGINGTKKNPGLVQGADQLAQGMKGDGTEKNPGLAKGSDSLADGAEQYADGADQYADGMTQAYQGLRNGTGDQPGLPDGARQIADGVDQYADGVGDYTDGVQQLSDTLAGPLPDGNGGTMPGTSGMKDAINAVNTACADGGGDNQCGQAAQLLAAYAQAADQGLNGDGTEDNPGLVEPGKQLNGGAKDLSDGADQYADGVEQGLQQTFVGQDGSTKNPTQESLLGGAQGLAQGADGIADGNRQFADQIPQLVDGVDGLASGIKKLGDGTPQLADGASQLADGVDQSADGAHQLSDGASQYADGVHKSADGAGQLASGADQLADGTDQLSDGTKGLADGTSGLADGTQKLADGNDKFADGIDKYADGTTKYADGVKDGADQMPTYSTSDRKTMSDMGAQPIESFSHRDNEAAGADTATFPFVLSLALWLGAFGTFLLLPALSKKLLASAVPMWQVVLRSLLPGLIVAVVQTVAVLALLTGIGIDPISPLAVGLVSLSGAIMFAAFHQALLSLFGERVGRIASIVLMVLQVVILAGILPLQTAPQLLQDLSGLMPLSIVSQGLVHASLGGSLTSTTVTLLSILAWFAISLIITLVFSRGARNVKPARSGHGRKEPVAA